MSSEQPHGHTKNEQHQSHRFRMVSSKIYWGGGGVKTILLGGVLNQSYWYQIFSLQML